MERDMENGSKKWGFQVKKKEDEPRPSSSSSRINVREALGTLMGKLNKEDKRTVIPLGHGDPSAFSCFRTTPLAEDAIVDAVRSGNHNHYVHDKTGLIPARRSVAEYLSLDLPYKLNPDDVFLTLGCIQAIDVAIAALDRPGGNILFPRPGFPYYELRAEHSQLEVRHFDLLPEKGWEVDLDAVEALADENTVAMVIINPGNPCGSVYSYEHLEKVAETARKLGLLVIADEVYGHLAFGNTPFVPMGVFGSTVPVLTLGSISKRWVVPGWRLGWIVATDPNGIIKYTGLADSIKNIIGFVPDAPTFIQAAIPQLIENTKEDFFLRIKNILKDAAEICYDRIQDISCITCYTKPEGSMFVMVKIDMALLEDITDDLDFSFKLAKEESVIVLPGSTMGMKNWIRVTFGIDPSLLEDGLGRVKSFCERHAKKD